MFYVRTTPHTHKGNRRRGAGRLVALLLLLPTLAVLGAQASPAAATSELCEGDVKVEVQGETYFVMRERDVHAVAAERLGDSDNTGLYL